MTFLQDIALSENSQEKSASKVLAQLVFVTSGISLVISPDIISLKQLEQCILIKGSQ